MFDDQMAGHKLGTNWSFVVNLANSIIGVAVLAFPLCFKQCGVVLGLLLLGGCAWLAYTSCCLLAKAASATKKRSYEYLAFHIFGSSGKLVVEICSAGLLLGTLIAFFVIVGDICPEILSEVFDVENSTQLRTTVLVTLGLLVILPLCMKSNLESISNLSTMSLVFYCLFAARVILSSLHHISTGEFVTDVKYWDFSGVFRSLPIFAVSYACQIQLFLVYHSTPDISIPQIGGLVWRAIVLSSTIYFSVGYFGYLAFYDKEVSGDVMMNYETTFSTGIIKMGFVSSTILSFPLVVYPCRCSLYTLISSKNLHENLGGTVHIPSGIFKYITCFIVTFTLVIGILVPKVEFVLGLMGSTLGSIICFILPGIMFLMVITKDTPLNMFIAKSVLFLGVLILVVSTWTTLSNVDMETHLIDSNNKIESNDVGEKFDLHDNKDDKHLPFVTAPPGLIIDPGVIGTNLTEQQIIPPVDLNDPSAGKTVHSNLAVDLENQNPDKPQLFDPVVVENKDLKDDNIKEVVSRYDLNLKPEDQNLLQKNNPLPHEQLNNNNNQDSENLQPHDNNIDNRDSENLQPHDNNNNNQDSEHLQPHDNNIDNRDSENLQPQNNNIDNQDSENLQPHDDKHLEMVNMKKLLNVPNLENEQNPAVVSVTPDDVPSQQNPTNNNNNTFKNQASKALNTSRIILNAMKSIDVSHIKETKTEIETTKLNETQI